MVPIHTGEMELQVFRTFEEPHLCIKGNAQTSDNKHELLNFKTEALHKNHKTYVVRVISAKSHAVFILPVFNITLFLKAGCPLPSHGQKKASMPQGDEPCETLKVFASFSFSNMFCKIFEGVTKAPK